MHIDKPGWSSWLAILLLTFCVGACDKNSTPTAPEPPAATTFTLSGTVTNSATAAPIAGATVRITGGTGTNIGKNTTTNAAGQYSLVAIAPERIVLEVTASGYNISSSSPTISANTTLNFSLTPIVITPSTFTVSGIVTDATSGGVLPNIAVRIVGGTSPNFGKNATTDAAGRYSITGVKAERVIFEAYAPNGGYQEKTASPTVTADTTVNFIMSRVAPTTTGNLIFRIDQASCGTDQASPIVDVYIDGDGVGTIYNQVTPDSQISRTVSIGIHAVEVTGSRGAAYPLTNVNVAAGVTVTISLYCTS